MKEFSVSLKDRLSQLDFIIIFCAFGMNLLSLLVLYGGKEVWNTRFFMVQTIASLLGIVIMFILSYLDYDAIISKLTIPIFIVSILLMATVLLFGVDNGMGNKNWIRIPGIPFTLQPSEFVKITFIITFSRHINRVKDNINNIKNVIALAIHGGIIMGLVLMTGDLGSTLVFAAIMAMMLFCAGLSVWYFIGAFAIIALLSPVLWSHMKLYQQERIIYGFSPELDPQDVGYQPLLSRAAISAGGFAGAGMFGGSVFTTLPQKESDFLFAVLCEKFGFIGGGIYIILMCVMVIRLIILARRARKDYGSLICIGVCTLFVAQTLENIGMCLAMLPVVGITLPFMSYGGSSMLAVYVYLGFVMSISSHNKKYYFERESS